MAMTFLEIVNKVLSTTGLSKRLDSVIGLDADSVEAEVVGFVQDAQLDTSRKIPNIPHYYFGTVTTVDDTTATASASSGNTLTLTAAGQAAWVGRILKVDGDNMIYRILNIAGTTLYLGDFAGNAIDYRNTAISSNKTVRIAQNRYLLPKNFKRPISTMDFFNDDQLAYLGPEEFDYQRLKVDSRFWQLGKPKRYTIFTTNLDQTTGSQRFYAEFDPIPDDIYHYPFRFEGTPTRMEADSDVSGLMDDYESAIVARSRYYVYKFLKRDMEMATVEMSEWNDIFKDQQKNPVGSADKFQMQPVTHRAHWSEAYDA